MQERERSPHIVWLMADQLRWDALGFTGNDIVRTPHLDRLAKSGVVFDNMFVQSPVCVSSRACMLTSRYLRNLNMANSCPLLDPREVTIQECLQRRGYRTGLFGKLHLTPQLFTRDNLNSTRPITDATPFLEAAGIPPIPSDPCKRNYGFQHTVGFEDILWGEYLDWLVERHPDVATPMLQDAPSDQEWTRADFQKAFVTSQFPGGSLGDVGCMRIPAACHPSRFIAESAAEYFETHHAEAPCFMHVSFVDPHHPWDPPAEVAANYPPEDMPLPKHLECPLRWPPMLSDRAANFSDVTHDMMRTTKANYYAMIETFDMAVGHLIHRIEAAGELDNTVFVFVADHGELLGDFGLFRKGSYHFDSMIRTPCFISAPGQIPGGRRIPELVESVDITPTLLGLANMPVHEGMQGINMADDLRQGGSVGREYTYTDMFTTPNGPYVSCQTLRTRDAKLNFYPEDNVGMLFDLSADPDECHDLWDDPTHRELRMQMTGLMLHAQYEHRSPLPRVISQF
ncbi:MAG: sulfatase-like hydrolase/transferase [Lentisphaeria bacterium]|nr:sulfatase-like hydrolase/transferase [Lentisphaeria bacterium]